MAHLLLSVVAEAALYIAHDRGRAARGEAGRSLVTLLSSLSTRSSGKDP
jgi:hypothetical protein